MKRLILQSQYARRTGYSRARITQLVKQGVIELVDGKVDPLQAEIAIREKVFRPRRLRSQKEKGVCEKCLVTAEAERFFCPRLNSFMVRAIQAKEDKE